MISVVETVVFYSDLLDTVNLVVLSCTFSVNHKIRTVLFIDDDVDSYTLYIL